MTLTARSGPRAAALAREQRFAAALAHDLRTPLSSLSGEVELALRRDRSPAEYRDALARISARVAELLELSDDLAVLGEPPHAVLRTPVPLDEILDAVSAGHAETPPRLAVSRVGIRGNVLGERARLQRAITLLANHAVRQCRAGAHVVLSVPEDGTELDGMVTITLEATAPGFYPRAWTHLAPATADEDANAPGEFVLRAAARMIGDCGGTLALATGSSDRVALRLRCA